MLCTLCVHSSVVLHTDHISFNICHFICFEIEIKKQKTLPFNFVCLALFVDFILFSLLTALFVTNSWSLSSITVRLNNCFMDIKQCCLGLSKPRYQRVLSDENMTSPRVEDDSEDEGGFSHDDDIEGVDDLGLSSSPERFYPAGFVEDRAMSQRAAVQVVGLTKTFQRRGKKGKKRDYALNRCCLEMREGELTVLMGQNGAGKTTLISCLTGSLKANSGRASVLGYNALDSRGMLKLRQSIGICPQEDAVFEGFTPREMLLFYASLKGVEESKCHSEVDAMLSEMGLTVEAKVDSESPKSRLQQRKAADMCVEELSGGQRRRVSIGIALIGDSKFVVLDEPTSAMDPVGKHQVWTLLRRMRAKRTILLTTHLMDEADACADRVAVMAKGQIHCTGSPSFLKRNVGAGYSLTLAKQPIELKDSLSESEVSDVTLSEVSAWVSRHLGKTGQGAASSVSTVRSGEDSVVMTLPFNVNASAFFKNLDVYLKSKGLSESVVYGVEMPSLESVFLTITERALGITASVSNSVNSVKPTGSGQLSEFEDLGIEENNWLRFLRQCKAVARFRLHISFQGRLMSTLGLVLPSSLAFGGGALVLGAMHSLGTEGRCAMIASMLLSCVFTPGFLASELLLEREKGLRHLLTVSGCGVNSFWFGTWMADLVSSQSLPILTLWTVSHVCQIDEWIWHPAFYISSLLFMLHQTLLGSIMSFTFRSSTSASLFGPGMIIVTTILVPCLVVLGLAKVLPPALTDDLPFEKGGTLLYTVATCSPHMLFWSALIAMEAPIDTDPPPSTTVAVSMQCAGCLFLMSCVLFFDSTHTSPIRPTGSKVKDEGEESEDEDVKREQALAEASEPEDLSHFLRLVKLRKEYRSPSGRPVVAVKSISLVVKQGECLGLLGPNGAGIHS